MVPTEFDKCTSIKLQTEIKNDPLKFDIFLRCLKDSYNIFNHTIYLKKTFFNAKHNQEQGIRKKWVTEQRKVFMTYKIDGGGSGRITNEACPHLRVSALNERDTTPIMLYKLLYKLLSNLRQIAEVGLWN